MSFFSSSPGAIKPKAPAIRKETRPVNKPSVSGTSQVQRPPQASSNGLLKPSSSHRSGTSSPQPRKISSGTNSLSPPQRKLHAHRASADVRERDRAAAVRKTQKRQSSSPSVQFGSLSEGESDDDEAIEQQAHKRVKSKRSASPDAKRRVRDVKNWSEEGGSTFELEHSARSTSGEYEKDYFPAFDEEDGDTIVVSSSAAADVTTAAVTVATPVEGEAKSTVQGEAPGEDQAVASLPHRAPEISLQYPSASQQEDFRLVHPRESDGYNPLSDIVETITSILTYYLPSSVSAAYLDESTGIPFRLRRAIRHRALPAFRTAISDFNALITANIADGTISRVLDTSTPSPLPLPLVELILTQVYTRTVSPRVHILKSYRAASDNVYGELLPRFVSQIFADAGLKSQHVFLDLGSGVGNAVLQAALEVGAESWGIEMMPNPCRLADAQAAEFPARCRLWGLDVGAAHLLQGDFLEDGRVGDVLRRADVVLVNNQAFQPHTNDALVSLLLDLKEGARLVSLKSFVPSGFRLTQRTRGNPAACLDVRKLEYWHDSVSWTHRGGEYFVATKDSKRIERILGVER